MCQEREKNGVNIISLIQEAGTQYITFFSFEDIAVVKEYEIIMLKYYGKACRLYIYYILVHP